MHAQQYKILRMRKSRVRADDIRPYKDAAFADRSPHKDVFEKMILFDRVKLCRGGYHPPASQAIFLVREGQLLTIK
jgi:hypothetical protein